jgi:UDP-N-acetylmuramoylalanine--D-glutamate ligase
MKEATRTNDLARMLQDMRSRGLDEARQGPHSLRVVATVEGVEYVDDSRSTFLDASLLSIADLGRPLVWVVDASMAPAIDTRLQAFLDEHVDATVFFGEVDRELVERLDAGSGKVYDAGDLRTAVFAARELAGPGSRVLFSPACPSSNGSANHAERAAEFKRAVMDL